LCFNEPHYEPLKYKLIHESPRSSLIKFLDFALLSVGSSFTVGYCGGGTDITSVSVMARFSQPQSPEHSSILLATLVIKHACEMVATPERAHKMVATTAFNHISADLPESRHNLVTGANCQILS